MTTFRGMWPALVTPFTSENTVNIPVLRDLVEYHLAKQVDGFYVCGRTGQGLSMSGAERQLIAETVIDRHLQLTVSAFGRYPCAACLGVTDDVAERLIGDGQHVSGAGRREGFALGTIDAHLYFYERSKMRILGQLVESLYQALAGGARL